MLKEHSEEGDDNFPAATESGPLVMPGNYSARLFQKVDGVVSELAAAQNFQVIADGMSALSPEDRAAQQEFHRRVARLFRAVSGAVHTAEDVEARLKSIREALREAPAGEKQLGAV